MSMKKALTIAGSDTSGGAGMQADLKTFQEHQVYGMVALTTIVTMDPNNWSHSVHPIPLSTLEAQLATAFSTEIDAVKTGMLGSVEIIELAAKAIKNYKLNKVVIDPVMVCKGEAEVLHPETVDAMRDLLLPQATIVTPNLIEARHLAQVAPLRTIEDMQEAAKKIYDFGVQNVVIKGGTRLQHERAIDLFYDGKDFTILDAEKIDTNYNHGAGCTFAAAITANLANGQTAKEAAENAKTFVHAAIRHAFPLNSLVGPVMHGAYNIFHTENE
ncbi:pyridoxine kinase [Oikeobacillus pervagus]|uniref:pyridoxal kinase n=1 Tax=Oikeobacillus pervagus TaxID=1325931 RepID=A0AAJ1SYT2_9BACI|nr:pyridoxine/pyridoxal/pyridoxamine kinase [Oikeobacillus pervagus]MDQ0215314.1 pyridoxine kinase [Oikeobacillus pervagus]